MSAPAGGGSVQRASDPAQSRHRAAARTGRTRWGRAVLAGSSDAIGARDGWDRGRWRTCRPSRWCGRGPVSSRSPARGSPSARSRRSPTRPATRGSRAPASRAGRSRRSSPRRPGGAYAIALPSCTAGLHLSLMALGVGPGDEVIVPETTWIATAAPITYVGATPIFVDVEPDTWCISVESAAAADHPADQGRHRRRPLRRVPRSRRPRGAVRRARRRPHRGLRRGSRRLARRTCRRLVRRRLDVQLPRLQDADHGRGRHGRCATTRRCTRRMLFLRDHGRLPGDVSFRSVEVAWKYKMSELQAALGRVQLDRIDELIDQEAPDLRLVRRPARPDPASPSTSTVPASGPRTGWSPACSTTSRGIDRRDRPRHARRRGHRDPAVLPAAEHLPAFAGSPDTAASPPGERRPATTSPRGRSTSRRP